MEIKSKTDFEDRVMICKDCGLQFTFTTGEQFFFHGKGMAEPKRCPECRKIRRQTLVHYWREGNERRNQTTTG